MAEGSRVAISYLAESVWGTKAVGQYKYLNFESESLKLNKEKEKSKKVLPTREYGGMVKKTQSVDGDFSFSLQKNNFDEFYAAGLMAAWIDVTGGAGGGAITAGATVSNLHLVFTTETGGGVGGTIQLGTSITYNIVKGQVIFISGATHPANNGSFIVKNVAGRVLTVNSPLTTATYQALTKISGDRLFNGSTEISFTIEREHADIAKFFDYMGVTVSMLEFEFTPEKPVMAKISLLGKNETTASITSSTGTPVVSSAKPEFITGVLVDGVYFDYVAASSCLVQSFKLKIDNQSETRKSIAVFGPCAIRVKSIDVSGSVSLFFTDFVQYLKWQDDTPTNIVIIQGDSLGNKYAFILSKAEFMTGNANTKSLEDQVPEEHDFNCYSGDGFTVGICRLTI